MAKNDTEPTQGTPDGFDSPDDGTFLANEDTAALIERLSIERDEAIQSYKRALADFANFQRRASESELRARDGGVMFVARTLMPVLDQMDLTLAQDQSKLSMEQLLQATGMVRSELNKALAKSGIERLDPKTGEEFDPHFHEAVMRQPVDGVPPNRVATCFQAGYRLGDMPLRPAKVSVTPE